MSAMSHGARQARSIDKRLGELEQRLKSERGGGQGGQGQKGAMRRPRGFGFNIPAAQPSQAMIDTDARLNEILSMSGALTVDGRVYRSKADDLLRLGELGNGTCGNVVKMLHAPSQAVIAVKIMRRSGNPEENKRILMDLEVVLRSHDCPYIVRCVGYFITDVEVWICMELMASCFDKILKRHGGPIPEDIIRKVTVATVEALSYLKDEHGVIHRDVKPSNILVDDRGAVKLCDFGISGRLVDSKAKTRGAGCAAYMAPERINPPDPQKPDYDIRADVWSLGITLVELATGNYPYRDCANDFEVLTKVIQEEPPALPDGQKFSEEFKSFVRQCLTKDYLQRPKYAALLKHPFVKKATQSGICVANWLASALPPESPRLNQTPPIIRRRHHNNSIIGERKLSEEHSSAHSTPSSDKNSQSFSPNHSEKLEKLSNDDSPSSSLTKSEIESGMSNLNLQTEAAVINSDSSESKKLEGKKHLFSKFKIERDNNISDNLISVKTIQIKPIVPHTEDCESPLKNDHSSEACMPVKTDFPQPHRDRSYSNTVVYTNIPDRWQFNKHPPNASPNTKNYFENLEMKNQPFPGGGPSSFDNCANYNRRQELMNSGYRHYGSPEVTRRQYLSPCRRIYDYRNKELESQHQAEVAANPPQFKTNGPTSYFTSTAVCTVSRFPPSPALRHRNNLMYSGGGYHQNPGGSCSQPASWEAYRDGCPRTPEHSFSPPLRSPLPAPRWGAHKREEKDDRDLWRNPEINQMGNTSPIVLQRYIHQQSQRRSRRDWDSSSRQSSLSLSRDTSIGRSPEPPRRAYRDPSLPRDSLSATLKKWSERERAPSQQRPSSKNDSMSSIGDNPIKCENDPKMEHKEFAVDNGDSQFDPNFKISSCHHHMREPKHPRDVSNGHCHNLAINNSSSSFAKHHNTTAIDVQECVESKKECTAKDKKHKKDRTQENREENCCNSNLLHRNGKNTKEKDDQGGSRSSSPGAPGGSARASRLPISRRNVVTCEYGRPECPPHGMVTTGLRLSGGAPQPPPRKAAESWSLPASPLPTRPI